MAQSKGTLKIKSSAQFYNIPQRGQATPRKLKADAVFASMSPARNLRTAGGQRSRNLVPTGQRISFNTQVTSLLNKVWDEGLMKAD